MFAGGVAVDLGVGTVEGGVVGKAALGEDVSGGFAVLQQAVGQCQALEGDIVPNGGAGGFFEKAAQLGFADIKMAAQTVQAQGRVEVAVDIADDAVAGGLPGGVLLGGVRLPKLAGASVFLKKRIVSPIRL